MSLTYGKYNDKGFGFHGGVQWMFENMDINDYLGLPLSVSWSSDGARSNKHWRTVWKTLCVTPTTTSTITTRTLQ